MKHIRIILLTLMILTFPAALLIAQEDAVAILEYYDNDLEVQILDSAGAEQQFFPGFALSPGDRVITGRSGVELRLQPNGSIARIGENTTFLLDSLQGRNGAGETRATLGRGRVRMVAARVATEEQRYTIQTRSAVAGVRGTDFALVSDDEQDEAFVFEGEIIVEEQGTGDSVILGNGEGVTLDGSPLVAMVWPPERVAALEEGLSFATLDPSMVPGRSPEEPVSREPTEPEPEVPAIASPAPATAPVPAPAPAPVAPSEPSEGFGDRLFEQLASIMGLQVGSVTINNETWGQVVFQPRIQRGRLDLAFFLPITYSGNIFDGNDWYQPEGNNEWSFGTDQDWSGDTLGALSDLALDLALKIRYIQFADRGDPFFFKVGNVSNLTLGQGLLMRNYANDTEFPTIRRIGFNLGFDRQYWGFEGLTNDLNDPSIVGGRLYFRPAAPVIPAAVGLSSIIDRSPSSVIPTELPDDSDAALEAARTGAPLFLNVAADLEIPIMRSPVFSLVSFAEAGGLIPVVSESAELGGTTISSGVKTSALVDFNTGELRNFGWTLGVRGNILPVEYQLQYLNYDGTFRPGFYGPGYDRLRGGFAADAMRYLSAPNAPEFRNTTMAVAGEASVSILGLIDITAGYLWPWEITPSGSWQGSDNDELLIEVGLRDGLIPFGIQAGLEYRRVSFAATVAGWGSFSEANLFDANTVLDGYVMYPLNSFISIVARVSTATLRDSNGELIYDEFGRPRMAPTVVIQTEIGL